MARVWRGCPCSHCEEQLATRAGRRNMPRPAATGRKANFMNSRSVSNGCAGLRPLGLALCAIAAAGCVNNAPGSPSVGSAVDAGTDAAIATDAVTVGTDDSAVADAASDAAADPDAAIAPDGSGDDASTLPDAASDTAGDGGADDALPTDAIADAVVTDVPPADAGPETTPADTADATADTAVDPPKPGLAAPCDTDDDCAGAGAGKKCDLASHSCVLCLTSKDCVAGELC